MSFTNRTSQALLNALFGNTSNFGALASAPTIHVALFTADPTEAGLLTNEVADTNAYARVATAAADWEDATLADPSLLDNATLISFPTPTGSWGTVTHFALIDSATHGAGNMIASGALTASRAIASGDTVTFPIGDLDLTLD